MLLVNLVLAAVVSWAVHRTVRDPTLAGILSILVSLPIVVILGQPHFGWFDATFWENLTVSGFICAAATIVVGVYVRRTRTPASDPGQDT